MFVLHEFVATNRAEISIRALVITAVGLILSAHSISMQDLSRYRDYEAADASTALDEARTTNKAAFQL